MRVFIPEFSPSTGMRRGDQCGRQCRDLLPGSLVLQAINNAIDTNSADVGRRLTVASVAFGDEDGLVSTSSAHAAPGDHLTYTNPGYTHMRNDLRNQGVGQLKDDGSLAHDAVFTTTDESLIDPGSRPGCAAAQFTFGGCRSAHGFIVNTIGFPDKTGQNIAIVGKTCGTAPYVEGLDIAGFLEFAQGQSVSDAKLLLDGTLISDAVVESGTRGTGQKYFVLTTPRPYSFNPPSGVSTTAGEHTLTIEATISNPGAGSGPQRVVRQAVFTAVPRENCSNPQPNPLTGDIPEVGDPYFDGIKTPVCAIATSDATGLNAGPTITPTSSCGFKVDYTRNFAFAIFHEVISFHYGNLEPPLRKCTLIANRYRPRASIRIETFPNHSSNNRAYVSGGSDRTDYQSQFMVYVETPAEGSYIATSDYIGNFLFLHSAQYAENDYQGVPITEVYDRYSIKIFEVSDDEYLRIHASPTGNCE